MFCLKRVLVFLVILVNSLLSVAQINIPVATNAEIYENNVTWKSNTTKNIGNGDTLIVKGNLTLDGKQTVVLQPHAVLVVYGDFVLNKDSKLELKSNAILLVKGDLYQKGNSMLGLGIYGEDVGDIDAKNSFIIVEGDYKIDHSMYGNKGTYIDPGANGNKMYVFGQNDLSSVGISNQPFTQEDLMKDKNVKNISELLPIELITFTASQEANEVVFNWITNSEVNNDYFTVEYSIDGVSFKTLETVAGSGTTSEVNEYAITTESSRFNGVVYFRLKQTDYNGEYSYSDVITLAVESSNELYVYPNPTTEFVSVSGTYKSAVVQDMFGKKVAVATNGEQIFVGNLSAGTYYVVVATENGKKVLPFVKE